MSVLPILPRGFVVGRVLTSRGDSADADKYPDTAVAAGEVDFTPATAYRKLDAFTAVTHSAITAKLDSHGDLHPQRATNDNTGSDTEDGIWLPVGKWKVTYRLNASYGTLPEHQIEVTTAHTEAAPLPLFANLGDPAPAGATFVQLSVPLGGQQGQVLVMNDGSLAWGDVSGGTGMTTEGVQDIVGAMVTGAGGTYDDTAGTITLPAGGGTVQAVTLSAAGQAVTLAAGSVGDVATLIITNAGGTPAWDAAITWEGGVGPTLSAVTGERDVLTFLYTGDDWLGFVSGQFPALPDAEAPTAPSNLTATATSDTTVDLSWTASIDNEGVLGYEYRVDAGAAVDAFAGTTETVSGLTAATLYSFEVRAYDAQGNRSAWSTAATATTQAAPIPSITDTFTRADSATDLGTTETGARAWTATGGVYGVASGKAYLVSGLAADRPSATVDLGSLNQDIRVAFTGTYVASPFYQMIVGRWADKANCYQMIANWSSSGPGIITLGRRIEGSNTTVYTSPQDTYPPTGGVMRLYIKEEVGGTRLRAYLGETLLTDFLDTNASRPAVSTRAGIAMVPNASLTGDARFDDFEALIP